VTKSKGEDQTNTHQHTMHNGWTRNNFSIYVPTTHAHAINLGHKWKLTHAQIENSW